MRTRDADMHARIALIGFALCVAPRAAPADEDPATAEHLFREGKRLMSAGKTAEACAAFEASYRNDPEVSTLLNLADCREKNGQIASAWGLFVDADRRSRAADSPVLAAYGKTARERAAALEPRMSFLTIDVGDDARLPNLSVSRNGATVDSSEWGRALPVDGGEYTVEVHAPDYHPWHTTIRVGPERDKAAVAVPRLEPIEADASPPVEAPRPTTTSRRRMTALAIGGAGLVGLGIGTGFFVASRGPLADARVEENNQRQGELFDSANRRYLYAQLCWGLGAGMVVAGGYLWISGRERERTGAVTVAPIVTPRWAGFTMQGGF